MSHQRKDQQTLPDLSLANYRGPKGITKNAIGENTPCRGSNRKVIGDKSSSLKARQKNSTVPNERREGGH